MSEPTSPDDRAVGPPEHLHPMFLLGGLGRTLRSLAGGYAVIAWIAVSKSVWLAFLAAVGLLLVGVTGIFLRWFRFEYRVGADEIRIDHGIVSRTHRSIPFDRIQDVDITQGPLQRLLGLAEVTFETGGGAAGRHPDDGALNTITLARAEQIRALVRSRARAGRDKVGSPTCESPAEHEPIYAMNLPRLLLAGTFNFSLAILAVLFGFTQTLGNAVGFDPFTESFWRAVLSAGDPLARYAERHQRAAVIAGALLLVIAGFVTGIVRTVVREFGFRLDRTDVGLRRRRGLFTRTDVTLPIKRAQAVVVSTGPVRDRFGWRELKLQSLARDENGKGDHVLAPLANDSEVDSILAQLGWRRLASSADWQRVSFAYVSGFAVAISPLFLVAMIQAAYLWQLAATSAVALLAATALRRLTWQRTAYALDGDRLLIRNGWWRRTITILPIAKIQSIDLSENFVTRRIGIARLTFGVAGGGSRGHSIPAIPRDTARQLRDQLLSSGT